jgi:phage head maturation protease
MAAFKKSVVGLPAYQAFAVMMRSKMKWEEVRGTVAETQERVREETENIRK